MQIVYCGKSRAYSASDEHRIIHKTIIINNQENLIDWRPYKHKLLKQFGAVEIRWKQTTTRSCSRIEIPTPRREHKFNSVRYNNINNNNNLLTIFIKIIHLKHVISCKLYMYTIFNLHVVNERNRPYIVVIGTDDFRS